jgi:hypothetical protein
MSNAFTNFLSGVVGGVFGSQPYLKDYQHADRLYHGNNYARAPKAGFLYFVNFNINTENIRDARWRADGAKYVGMLVKKTDMPRFRISTETLNQYNRKTVVQTKISYEPLSLEFHDDNSDITTALWKNYYRYYYTDSVYGGDADPSEKSNTTGDLRFPAAFKDTKYSSKDNIYGFDSFQDEPFFKSIDIYVMHQHKFTQVSLINPLITEWAHDGLDQSEGNKILGSRMQIAYEDVLYSSGSITKTTPTGYQAFYDNAKSPLAVGGNGSSSIFGSNGILAGAANILGANPQSPLDFLGLAIQAKNLVSNVKGISKSGIKGELYGIANGVLGNIAASGNQPGGVTSQSIGAAAAAGVQQSGLGVVSQYGINLFSTKNSSVNNSTPTTPSTLTGKGPGKG